MKLRAFFLSFIMAAVGCLTVSARDNYSYDVQVLPAAARNTIDTHFKKSVNHIKIDRNMFGIEGYDVVLNDGTEIEFDSDGKLKDVECGIKSSVPDGLIMKDIRDYVKANYPKTKIVQYEVKRSGYEIQLNTGVELEFNRQGVFQRVDR